MSTTITVVGNAAGDPELRFTPNGTPVASFSLAVNKRKKDGDNWVDDGTDWYRVTAWRELGQNVADSIEKGTRVLVSGRLAQREWEAKDGAKRLSVEITADEIGPSLRWATAKVNRNERLDRSSSGGASGGAKQESSSYDPAEEPF